MCIADKLIEKTILTKNPVVIGLDPVLSEIPSCYKVQADNKHPFEAVANVITDFNRDIIDTVAPFVPAVKPQIAFYEKYGSYGIKAFEATVEYAKSKGLVVIADAKRNDIENTASAYSDAFLGKSETLNGNEIPAFDVDFLTISSFLGSDSILPFAAACEKYNKGIFILVKTSNKGSGEIQDSLVSDSCTVSQHLAKSVAKFTDKTCGSYGYSSVGAVVGATYPDDAARLRKMMPKSYWLVPGYGAQGGNADDIVPCFNSDGLGAVVNSSRGILYTHLTKIERDQCTREEYLQSLKKAVLAMQKDIYGALKNAYSDMVY